MITVTESAKEELKRISLQATGQPESILRLVSNEQGQLGLVADSEREGDQVIEHQGETVLVVDSQTSAALDGVGMDYQDAEDGPRLVLTGGNPEEPTGQD